MVSSKNRPAYVGFKLDLAARLSALRSKLFADQGGPEMARQLGLPARTWDNYERGVTVPGHVILESIRLTSVETEWLLNGQGPIFPDVRPERPAENVSSHGGSGHPEDVTTTARR